MFVKPEEKRFVTADLIRATSFTASEAEIKQRIDALARRRLHAVHDPARPGPGTGARRLGAHPPGICLKETPAGRSYPSIEGRT